MSDESSGKLLSEMTEDEKLKRFESVETRLTVEAGSAAITIRDLLRLNVGSVVELSTLAGEHLDILVNGTVIAKGEIVTIGETLGIRLTQVVTAAERKPG
jgi:flagellar motor switch protein FliN